LNTQALELVQISDGLEKTRELAASLCEKASHSIKSFPESSAKEALMGLTHSVLNRKK
jgi:geranylgeranyl pyrophosphate synthase